LLHLMRSPVIHRSMMAAPSEGAAKIERFC
jgi:hypothetical protein